MVIDHLRDEKEWREPLLEVKAQEEKHVSFPFFKTSHLSNLIGKIKDDAHSMKFCIITFISGIIIVVCCKARLRMDSTEKHIIVYLEQKPFVLFEWKHTHAYSVARHSQLNCWLVFDVLIDPIEMGFEVSIVHNDFYVNCGFKGYCTH